MRKIVIVDVNPGVGQDLGEVIRWAHEKVVTDHISYHLLVQIAICDLLPVGVLKQNNSHNSKVNVLQRMVGRLQTPYKYMENMDHFDMQGSALFLIIINM